MAEKKSKTVIASIKNIFDYYDNSDFKKVQEEFDYLMIGIQNELFICSINEHVKINVNGLTKTTSFRLSPKHEFFRVRTVNARSTIIEHNADELFHLPMTKRAQSNNERFSIAGFPSLYLASMLQLAWQESGYPSEYY